MPNMDMYTCLDPQITTNQIKVVVFIIWDSYLVWVPISMKFPIVIIFNHENIIIETFQYPCQDDKSA